MLSFSIRKKVLSILCFVIIQSLSGSVFAQFYHVNTYSGSGNAGFINGSVNGAEYNKPFGLCMEKNGDLYLSDGGNNCIRKVTISTGMVTTFAGSGIAGWRDGISDSAMFNSPSDLCVDDSGNIYVSDFLNHRIRKISPNGIVSTVAGSGIAGYLNGNSSTARFNYPRGICVDKAGNLYVGDSWNHRIRKIDVSGNVSTYAGGGNSSGVSSVGDYVDASDTSARFYTPSGLAIDLSGNVYVADAYNHRVRRIDILQNVITIAGSGNTGVGNGGYSNGPVSTSLLNTPTELFLDTIDNVLYIGDTFNNRIRSLNFSNNNVSTVAGDGTAGFTNAIDTMASFDFPRGIVVSHSGNKTIYVSDYNNHAIRIITSITSEIDNPSEDNEFTIYPNPPNASFIIDFKSSGEIYLEILDNTGRVIIEKQKVTGNNSKFDFSGFTAGVYFVKVTTRTGKIQIRKLVLN
jgi:hypothetical protein